MLIHKARSMLLVAPYGSDGGFHFQWRHTRRHSWGVRQELSTGLSLPPSCPHYRNHLLLLILPVMMKEIIRSVWGTGLIVTFSLQYLTPSSSCLT